MTTRIVPVLVLAVILAVLPASAAAQIGSSTDIITGVVTNAEGQPVEDATVEAYSLETQVTRRARTDARGRYTILFPDGGGQYRMTARAIGLSPRIELIQRHADEDRLVWSPRLGGGAVTLEGIEVRAGPQLARAPDGPTPGSTERFLGPDQLARLPVDNTDLTSLVGLVPGVVPITASDTTAAGYSVAGLGPDANALTLDGLLFGTSSIPQEALRQTRVVTSTYDVSRGQFSGGLIASTTRSGSNVVQGSSNYQMRDDDLSVTGDDSPFAQGFTQHVISGGLGGPLVRDRMFIFGSMMSRLRSDPQQDLLNAGRSDYSRLGVHPDSVARFLSILDSLGLPPAGFGASGTRSNNTISALVRLDYVLSSAHTLTLRGDWQGTSQDPARLGSLALPQTGGVLETGGGGVMATLTSRFGAALINEFRGYWSASRRDGDPYARLPQGRVVVASDLPDGALGVSTLVFGGNTGFPTRSRSRGLELTNELSWMPGRGTHRFKFGGFFLSERTDDVIGSNLWGTFSYSSLSALAAGSPSSFRRTVDVAERASRSYRWGMFAGDVWMVRRPLQLTYGLRLEGSWFGALPAYNPAVETAFGRRTDRLPDEIHISPRVGFSWTLGGSQSGGAGPFAFAGPPSTVIRGGIGEFRNQPPLGLAAQARAATGLAQATGELFCVGSSVPAPLWNQYRLDPSSIPDECAGSGPPPPSGFQIPRTVILLQDGFEAPRAWRGSLAVERRLTQLFRLTIEGSFSRGVSQSGFYDLNLDQTPAFTLSSEGGRPVFVAPSDIAPSTGEPRFAASRVDSAFGTVLEARSNLRSRSEQVSVGVGGIVGRGILLNLSYTIQRARDQATGLRGGGTAGNPNLAEWARSDFERRHSLLATITYPLSQSVEITSIGRLVSGAPFTPMIGGDVNGDGSRNDRAFIFAPGSGTPVEQGMQNLLAEASDGVRECLTNQVGRVAARNSCTGPWQASLDFQLNWRPAGFGLNRRLTVSVVTQNFLRGLDELLHGAAGARGWGLSTRPDNTLLYVTGFDQSAGTFNYQVNERFGSTAGTATAFRPPFQIGIQLRMQIGPDRMRQALDAMRAGGRGGVVMVQGGPGMGSQMGFRGPDLNPAAIIERIASALPNPAASALELRDSLRLDSAQTALLLPLRDSLERRNGERIDSLRRVVNRLGNNPGPNELMRVLPAMRPLFEAARSEIAQSLVTVRAILTPEQWQALPEAVRNFQTAGPRIMMGPPGQGQGPAQRPRP